MSFLKVAPEPNGQLLAVGPQAQRNAAAFGSKSQRHLPKGMADMELMVFVAIL